jgi:hypothetical protein
MRSAPGRLFALFGLLVFLGIGLGAAAAATDSAQDTGTSDALWTAGVVAFLSGLAVFPFAVLTALAVLLQQPGSEGRRRARGGLAVFCAVAWLATIALVWAGRAEETEGELSALAAIGLAWVALLPFALWPTALWLTAPERGRRPPLAPVGWLLAGAGTALVVTGLSM